MFKCLLIKLKHHRSIKENEEPIVSKDLKVGDVFLHKYGKTQPPWPCRITGLRRLTKNFFERRRKKGEKISS